MLEGQGSVSQDRLETNAEYEGITELPLEGPCFDTTEA